MMDVDNDLDQQLMQQFSCLGTQDKDVLISELQKVLGNQLSPAGCAFFLDMTNWNLQAAVGAYYDYEQTPTEVLPMMSVEKDITIGEGESVPPNTKFVQTWRLRNIGATRWPPGCCLVFVGGDNLGPQNRIMLEALEPSHVQDVSIELFSGCTPGYYQGQWRMSTPTGHYVGDRLWAIISVAEGGVLSITQQLHQFSGGGEFQQMPHQQAPTQFNPFASPSKTPPLWDHAPLLDPNGSPTNSVTAEQGSPVLLSPQVTPRGLAVPHVCTALFQNTGENGESGMGTDNLSPKTNSINCANEDEDML